IDVQPAVVVVIDQAHARAVRFKDKGLLWPTHYMTPSAQAGGFGHILKDYLTGFDKPTRSDRPSFSVVLGLVYAAVGHAGLHRRLGAQRLEHIQGHSHSEDGGTSGQPRIPLGL